MLYNQSPPKCVDCLKLITTLVFRDELKQALCGDCYFKERKKIGDFKRGMREINRNKKL